MVFRLPILFVAFASLSAILSHAAERRPNFLFLITDDHRWDAMGVVQREMGDRGRYPWLQTPHLDRLAAEGVWFRNAFVTYSLCAPSRAAFLTGRYNHLNGVANNITPFPEASVTHATGLRAAGYTTAYIGKWHMGNQRGPRPGFSYSASYVGQGKYLDCPFEIDGREQPTRGWVDDVSTDFAIEFMRQNRDRPFSVVVGFKSTHNPVEPPERAKARFATDNARRVPNLEADAIYRSSGEYRNPYEEPSARHATTQTAVMGRGQVRLSTNYFRCVSAADDNLGRLLAILDELGLAQDTVVVYASDNGFYDGEHGLFDKRSLYDESLRIPLLLRYPRKVPRAKIIDEMVLNIDLAPTWLELAGVAVPREMQGRSWVPLLSGPRTDWRDAFLAEYFYEARGHPPTPTTVAVRTKAAKLIKYPGHDDWTELFDLTADPYETKNLATNPAHRALLEKMNAEFERQAQAVNYHVPDYADKSEVPGKAADNSKSAKTEKKPAKDN